MVLGKVFHEAEGRVEFLHQNSSKFSWILAIFYVIQEKLNVNSCRMHVCMCMYVLVLYLCICEANSLLEFAFHQVQLFYVAICHSIILISLLKMCEATLIS